MRETFLNLVWLGIGQAGEISPNAVDWGKMKKLAEQQGLSAIIFDGIEQLLADRRPSQEILLHWIGEVLQNENIYAAQQKDAASMASLFQNNGIRTYVLKGTVVAECYPKPSHRLSVDMDCYLLPEKCDFDAWSLGNDLIRAQGFEVAFDYYKNSTFYLSNLTVENHQYFTPFRGNKRLTAFEKKLQSLIREDGGENRLEGTWLYRPPVMVTALFLIEHAYSNFLHEGLTWRMVLDWMMFSRKHEEGMNWNQLEAWIDEFGFKKFYDSYYRLGKFLIGELRDESLGFRENLMLEDVWAPLDLHESVRGWKGKLRLVGNTWRAKWKYKFFSEDTMLKALWIQVKGVLFDRSPNLNLK